MKLFTILLLSFYSSMLMADIPTFDIAKVKVGDDIYYTTFESRGNINEDDHCIYTYGDNFIINLEEYLIPNLPHLPLYTKLETIQFYISDTTSSKTYILKEPAKSILKRNNVFEILEIFQGGGESYGGYHNKELNKYDNEWVSYYPLEELFILEFDGVCEESFYAVVGNISKKEAQKIKIKLQNFRKKKKHDLYDLEVSKLYHRRILMFGFCWC